MKERSVAFSPQAAGDLLEIYDWIAEKASASVALSYVERLQAFCDGLGFAPERGHRRDDVRPGLRIIGFERRVTIAFSMEKDRVVILGLFYAGRTWEGRV